MSFPDGIAHFFVIAHTFYVLMIGMCFFTTTIAPYSFIGTHACQIFDHAFVIITVSFTSTTAPCHRHSEKKNFDRDISAESAYNMCDHEELTVGLPEYHHEYCCQN